MRHETGALRVIVLAAQRPGIVDPLAAQHGVSHKFLVPLLGRPLLSYVLGTVAGHPRVADVMISVEADAFSIAAPIIAALPESHAPVHCVRSADNLADSVIAAAEGHDGPILITTADNALLSAFGIDAMAEMLSDGAEVVIAMARQQSVLAAHPEGQRRFYRFRDDSYSNCNLYGIVGPHALAAAELFRGGGQFARRAGRIIAAFGLLNLVLLRFRLVSLCGGLQRISRRIGLRIVPLVLADGRHAIDVDNERTFRVVASLLAESAPANDAHVVPKVELEPDPLRLNRIIL